MLGQPLRGLVGQSMSGGRTSARPHLYRITSLTSAGSGSVTADYDGYAEVYIWGAGGSGLGNGATGAGSGAAVLRRVRVLKGQAVSYTLGAGGVGGSGNGSAGGDSIVVYPDGLRAIAGGGAPGTGVGAGAGGAATASGDTVTRVGSAGGNGVAGSDGADGGGAGGSGGGGGGGPPGFGSYITGLTYGRGGTTGLAPLQGGGSASNPAGVAQDGAAGWLLIYWFRFD